MTTTQPTTTPHLRLRIHLTPPDGPTSHMDATCSTTLPIAEIIPHLAGAHATRSNTPHTWHLTRPDGTELPVNTTLAEHHLHTGDTLHLAAHPAYTAAIHHHTPDALAHYTPSEKLSLSHLISHTPLPLAGAATAALCLTSPAGHTAPWWIALAITLLGALITAATTHAATTVILLCGAAATIAHHWPTTPTLLATLLLASLLITGISVLSNLPAIATLAAATAAATLASAALWALGSPQPWTTFAAALTLAGLSTHSLAARICLAATGIRPDDIPATAEADLPDPTPVPDPTTLGRALSIHAAIAAGAGLATITGALLLAALGPAHTTGAALAVCAAAGVAETLRSRLQARPIPHAMARLSGVVCLFAAAWVGCASHHPVALGAGIAAAVGAAAVAGWNGTPEGPVASKLLEWAELTATAVVIPLVMWAAGVFDMIRGLG